MMIPGRSCFRILMRLLALAVAFSALTVYLWWRVHTPYRGFPDEGVFVEIERGMNTSAIASRLHEAGVIENGVYFQIVRYLHPRASLQAGEYRFEKPASVLDVFGRLRRGDVYHVTLRIPEGMNIFEISDLVAAADLPNARDFLAYARDAGPVQDLAPEARTLEGYLFPSTYQFRRKATAAEIGARLTNEFRKQWKALGGTGDVQRIVTLASLVEKETSVDAERPLVASVYSNRLREGMRLDCDPTVIYAALLEGKYRGTIYRSDLNRIHDYNTYQRTGLPPGPIANPGFAALQAALRPAQTNYLFFVAKGDGSGEHRFSEDLAGHTTNVTRYRDTIKARSNGAANR